MRTFATFAIGFVSGWAARSALGPTRELMVQAVVATMKIRERMARVAAEQAEWAEDVIAEGRARFESLRNTPPVDEEAPVVLRTKPFRAA